VTRLRTAMACWFYRPARSVWHLDNFDQQYNHSLTSPTLTSTFVAFLGLRPYPVGCDSARTSSLRFSAISRKRL